MTGEPKVPPQSFVYPAMGAQWQVSIWDTIDKTVLRQIEDETMTATQQFDETYSRFKESSLISTLSGQTGEFAVPTDLVAMLRLYEKLYSVTDGKCSPLIANTLSDLGYDASYSLQPKETIRQTPRLDQCIRILGDDRIELLAACSLDFGALGKGYFVDRIAQSLQQRGIRHFLVNGSGDIYFRGSGATLRAGLEHPADPTKVIGVCEMTQGAMCSSAGNRRRWGDQHHIIDPDTNTSSSEVIATWVLTEKAAYADALATCLFFTPPEQLLAFCPFEYCLYLPENRVKCSPGFKAEFF